MLEIYRRGEGPVIDFGFEPLDYWSTEIIPKFEWGAVHTEHASKLENMPHPIQNIGVWGTEIIDSEQTGVCRNYEECCEKVLRLQIRDLDEVGLPEIRYNFLIGDDGNIYEGRGWDIRPQIYYDDTDKFKNLNKNMLEVAYVGICDMAFVHWGMYETFLKLIGQGVAKGYIAEDYKMWDLKSKSAESEWDEEEVEFERPPEDEE